MEEIRAQVRVVDGQVVLDDPEAVTVMRVVGKTNCRQTFALQAERVRHFKRRVAALGLEPADVVIVLLNVDDAHGGPLAETLMPGHDWDQYRERGEVPFARGLAGSAGITAALGVFDEEAALKLCSMTDLAVVVVDHGVAEVFPA
jgi:hypothetical protein